MCNEARYAGTTERTVAQLRALNRENADYWNAPNG
jgi:hypothetical protein